MNLISVKEPSLKNESNLCLGIDFGTTNSVCSIKYKNELRLIKDEMQNQLIPTIILFDNDKKIFGNDAIKSRNYYDAIFSVKRSFTENFEKKKFVNDKKEKFSAVEISRFFFTYLKDLCQNYLKQKVYDCVLTVPAYFDEKARSGIMRAAFMAGCRVKRLINEPTAAAFAYGLEKKRKGTFFVFDLGGGTFDVSLLKLSDGIFKVIGTGGDPNLGGDDFDYLFTKWVLKNINTNFDELSNSEKIRLIKRFKIVKEKLNLKKKLIEEIFLKGKKKKITITINDFNRSIEDLVDKTVEISSNLLKEVDISIEKVDGFILVGGSSRINLISSKLREKFKTKIFSDIDPDIVVSKGAALHGFELLNGPKNILLDVTPLSLGIETMGGLMEKIISRNSPIPAIKEQIFTTHENGQTSIIIKILQGERETSINNRCLGEFTLSNISPKPAGIPRVKVRFSLDSDGILFVSATDEESGNESDISLKTNENIDLNEMRQIVESSITNAKDDIEQRMIIEAKIRAKSFLNEILSVKKDLELLCSKNDIEKIKKIINMLNNELKTSNYEMINKLVDELNLATESFAQKRIERDFSSFVGKDLDKIS
ncbi:MAG: Hsp70 family protein [Pseudomonadota bacterium]|nr:Hsp70 family protein [Pseudomonadota bacterium]